MASITRSRRLVGCAVLVGLAAGCAPPAPGAADASAMDVAAAMVDRPPGGGDVGGSVQGRCPEGMVRVPGGEFEMGQVGVAEPVHRVRVSPFCLDVTEVTLGAYRSCSAAGCTTPGTEGPCNYGVAGRDLHPVNCIGWEQARSYCQWRGADLPTEAQWEFAARGADGRGYPWGNDAPASQLCWAAPTRSTTCPVHSFPAGDSPFGVADMAGNVWEWTLDWHGPYPATTSPPPLDPTGPDVGASHVVRGGSYNISEAVAMRAAYRYNDYRAPSQRNHIIGFRCARPAP